MAKVKFESITLSGFGPYRETVEFTFSERLNVLVAPNETGKSTLVAGVGAIIFGIPQTTDVAVFGQARFRNWDHPLRFEGELICTINGETFRFHRDFNSNQVSLAQRRGEEYREIISGTHNPRAQRRNLRYEEKIKALFGLGSQEIFEATFCLTQPLPEGEEIDGRVQELLSGTGASFNQATEKLTEELRTVTRFTGRLGVTARDAVDPRELELLAEQITQTKQEIEKDRELVDQLEAFRSDLVEQEKLRKEKEEALTGKERMLALWSEWKRLKESYTSARKVYSQINHGKERAKELSAELRMINQEKAAFPWGSSLPAETAEVLSELQSLSEQKTKLTTEIRTLESQLAKDQKLDSVQAVPEQKQGIDWDVFGPGTVSVIKRRQRQTEEALADWVNLQETKAAYQECQLLLEEEFSHFSGAEQETIETLKSYTDRKARLDAALESASLKLEKAKEALKKINRQGKFRRSLILGSALMAGIAASLLRRGGEGDFVLPLVAFLGGAGLGYLLGRVLFPVGSLEQVRNHLKENERNMEQALKEVEDFERLARPFEAEFVDIPAACRRWEKFSAQREELSFQLQEFSRRELGGFSGEAENCPLSEMDGKIGERWLELYGLARVVEPKESFQALGDLVNWLREKPPQWWEQLIDEAEDYEEQVKTKTEAKARSVANQEYLEKRRQELEQLKKKQERLEERIAGLLDYSAGDYDQAKRLWVTWRTLESRAEKTSESIKNILVTQRVDSLEKLEEKSDDASLQAQAIYSEWKKLIDDHPGLTGIEEAANPEKIDEDYRGLQQEVTQRKIEFKRVEEEIHRLNTQIARVEGQAPVNIAAAEIRLREMEERQAELELVSAALTLAYQEMTLAINDFQSSHRLRLAEVASGYYRNLTGLNNRGVEISEDFRVVVNIDGRSVVPAQLSHGARDQLYIALRLAIAQLLAEETILPFIFDDPFLNCDEERLANIHSSLSKLSEERQILLLSHRDDFSSWGKAVGVKKEDRLV